MFLGMHITEDLKWFHHTNTVVKKAQQRLYNLRRLKKFGMAPKTLANFCRCTIESILLVCLTSHKLHGLTLCAIIVFNIIF
jgi:hypothetical protein